MKVSCLCLEENVDNDPCKFALTSRAGDVMETFILHSTSPGVRQMWIHEINQILENQRNFLNGNVNYIFLSYSSFRVKLYWLVESPCLNCSFRCIGTRIVLELRAL